MSGYSSDEEESSHDEKDEEDSSSMDEEELLRKRGAFEKMQVDRIAELENGIQAFFILHFRYFVNSGVKYLICDCYCWTSLRLSHFLNYSMVSTKVIVAFIAKMYIAAVAKKNAHTNTAWDKAVKSPVKANSWFEHLISNRDVWPLVILICVWIAVLDVSLRIHLLLRRS